MWGGPLTEPTILSPSVIAPPRVRRPLGGRLDASDRSTGFVFPAERSQPARDGKLRPVAGSPLDRGRDLCLLDGIAPDRARERDEQSLIAHRRADHRQCELGSPACGPCLSSACWPSASAQ